MHNRNELNNFCDNSRKFHQTDMVKNVKIGDETHRRMSILASEKAVQKGELCTALIAAALDHIPDEMLQRYLEEINNEPTIDAAFPQHKPP